MSATLRGMTDADESVTLPPVEGESDQNPSAMPDGPHAGEQTPHTDAESTPADASREAMRYRLRLRETEAERDALALRIDGLERAEAERIARSAGMATPADLWTQAELADFRGDDGQ